MLPVTIPPSDKTQTELSFILQHEKINTSTSSHNTKWKLPCLVKLKSKKGEPDIIESFILFEILTKAQIIERFGNINVTQLREDLQYGFIVNNGDQCFVVELNDVVKFTRMIVSMVIVDLNPQNESHDDEQ